MSYFSPPPSMLFIIVHGRGDEKKKVKTFPVMIGLAPPPPPPPDVVLWHALFFQGHRNEVGANPTVLLGLLGFFLDQTYSLFISVIFQ